MIDENNIFERENNDSVNSGFSEIIETVYMSYLSECFQTVDLANMALSSPQWVGCLNIFTLVK